MAKKIRILQLSPRFPFPTDDGGKIGIANIFAEYARFGAEVTMFTFCDSEIRDEYLNQAEQFGKVIVYNYSTKNTPLRIIESCFKTEPLFVYKHINQKIKAFLKEFLNKNEFDFIHTDHSSMMPLALFAKDLLNIPVFLRLHNIEWLIWQRYADIIPKYNPKYYYIQRQANLLRKAETHFYNQADICFAITEPDRKRALEISPDAKIVVASAGVNLDEWIPDNSIKKQHQLILATTYDWVHNVDGLRWFLDRVMPLIKNEIPDAELLLLGKNPPEWLNDYKSKGLNLVGYVPDVKPYFNESSVYIAPLFVGGGIRIKILEAMAMQLPVVATDVSAEGIEAGESDGLFKANDPVEFSSQILRLLNNKDLRSISGLKARTLINEKYSWSMNVLKMISCYNNLNNIF